MSTEEPLSPTAEQQALLARQVAVYEDALDVAGLGAWEYEPATRNLRWSPGIFAIYGIDRTVTPTIELFYQQIHPDDLPMMQAQMQEILSGGPAYSLDVRAMRSDGSEIVTHARGNAIHDAEGKAIRLVGTVQDITRRYYAERAHRESEMRHRTLLESLPDPLVVYDTVGRVTYLNRRFEETFGWLQKDLIGQTIDFVPDEEKKAAGDVVRRLFANEGERSITFDSKRYTRSGRILEVQISATVFDGSDGEPEGTIVVLRDMTESRRLQAEFIALQQAIVAELSTPLMPINDSVIVMPLIGTIDSNRAQQITEKLLEGVAQRRAHTVILDITGVSVVDTQVADALLRTAQAVRLLGAEVVITGIGPEIAQTLVGIGMNLGTIATRSTLQSGIAYAMRHQRS